MIAIFIFPSESAACEKTGGLGGLTRFRRKGVFCVFTRLKSACCRIRNKDQDTSVNMALINLAE
jgi:hypothetical protein